MLLLRHAKREVERAVVPAHPRGDDYVRRLAFKLPWFIELSTRKYFAAITFCLHSTLVYSTVVKCTPAIRYQPFCLLLEHEKINHEQRCALAISRGAKCMRKKKRFNDGNFISKEWRRDAMNVPVRHVNVHQFNQIDSIGSPFSTRSRKMLHIVARNGAENYKLLTTKHELKIEFTWRKPVLGLRTRDENLQIDGILDYYFD